MIDAILDAYPVFCCWCQIKWQGFIHWVEKIVLQLSKEEKAMGRWRPLYKDHVTLVYIRKRGLIM